MTNRMLRSRCARTAGLSRLGAKALGVAVVCALFVVAPLRVAVAQAPDAGIPHTLLLALLESASGNSIPGLRVGVASDSLPPSLLSADMTILGSVSATIRSVTAATIALPVNAARDAIVARAQATGFTPAARSAGSRGPPPPAAGAWGPVVYCRTPTLIALSVHPRSAGGRGASGDAIVVIEHSVAVGTLCNPRSAGSAGTTAAPPGTATIAPPNRATIAPAALATGGAAAGATRRFVHPEFGWTIDCPASWLISTTNPEMVLVRPPTEPMQGLVGIHAARVTYKTAEEVVDATIALQQAKAPGFKVISRRNFQLADNPPAIELVTELGEGVVGHSRKLFMMVGNLAYIIDAESNKEAWSSLEPAFTRVIDSFRVRK